MHGTLKLGLAELKDILFYARCVRSLAAYCGKQAFYVVSIVLASFSPFAGFKREMLSSIASFVLSAKFDKLDLPKTSRFHEVICRDYNTGAVDTIARTIESYLYMRPLQFEDFIAPAPGEDQKPDRGNHGRVLAGLFGLGQHGAQAGEFLRSVVQRLEGYGPDSPLE